MSKHHCGGADCEIHDIYSSERCDCGCDRCSSGDPKFTVWSPDVNDGAKVEVEAPTAHRAVIKFAFENDHRDWESATRITVHVLDPSDGHTFKTWVTKRLEVHFDVCIR